VLTLVPELTLGVLKPAAEVPVSGASAEPSLPSEGSAAFGS
jgi:hypothetical protein